MRGPDRIRSLEIRDRSRHSQQVPPSPRAHAELFLRPYQQVAPRVVEPAVRFDELLGQTRIEKSESAVAP